MDRRSRRNALYTRMLAIGLGVSVLVHAALLGFGRLSFLKGRVSSETADVVSLPNPETQPEDRPDGSPEAWQLALDLSGSELAVLDLSEYDDVLAEATGEDLLSPVVPRPRLTAYVAESGFTPLRVPQPDRLTRRGRTVDAGPGGGMGGVIIVVGGGGVGPIDDCTPSGIGGRFPGGRRPVGPGR